MDPQYQQPSNPPIGNDPGMNNPLESMQPGEQTIFQLKRHPIGMIGIYVVTTVVLVILAILAFGVAPALVDSSNRSSVMAIGGVIFIIIAIIAVAYAFIANKVYSGNAWILTSDSITQVTQTSLFKKQSSQLSLNNLEDVTAEKNGILADMFNFGVLRVETAGERSKFMFPYCPNPNFYAQQVLQARERFEQAGRYEAQHYQEGQVTPGSAQFPAQPNPNYPESGDSGVDTNTQ